MKKDIPKYLGHLELEFEKKKDLENAFNQKKYMKNLFDFYGMKSPERRPLFRQHWREFGAPEIENIEEFVEICWAKKERDWQYFAMETMFKIRKQWTPDMLDVWEYMITHKSWWDTVDYMASNLVGTWLQKYPEQTSLVSNKWNNSDNIWLIRTSILFQLKYKGKTDMELLFKNIRPHVYSNEFFIQKAIGWALREYGKTNPDAVVQFCRETQLKPLSKREALRIILK